MPSLSDYESIDNPYSASAYSATAAPAFDARGYGSDEALELQAFVGNNASFYLRKWAPRLESPDGETGMNWAAFFLTYWWMGYRRMHLYAAIYMAACVAISIGLQVLFIVGFGSKTGAPLSATLVGNFMLCLVCGLCANGWYLSHARRKIADAQARGLEGQHLLFALQQSGGTSWPGFFAWFLGPAVVGVCLGLMLAVTMIAAHAPK